MNGEIDQLLTMAEISGVFLGFVGLTSAVVNQRDADEARQDVFVLVTIAMCCSIVIIGSFLPMTLQHYIADESLLWRVCAGGLWATNLLILYVSTRMTPGFTETHQQRGKEAIFIWALEPLLHISLLLCILGIWPDFAVAFYFTAQLVVFGQIVLMFVFFIIRFTVPQHDQEEE